jgi:hypothetical protein
MISKIFGLAAAATVLLSSSLTTVADNAGTQLTSLQLPVMINQTGTFVEAQVNMAVYPGDRLMAMGGGSATVQYDNGCLQSVSDNEIAEIGTPESCNTLAEAGTNFAVGSAAVAGGAAGGAAAAPITGGLVFAGTMAAGAGLVKVTQEEVFSSGNSNDNPPISR